MIAYFIFLLYSPDNDAFQFCFTKHLCSLCVCARVQNVSSASIAHYFISPQPQILIHNHNQGKKRCKQATITLGIHIVRSPKSST